MNTWNSKHYDPPLNPLPELWQSWLASSHFSGLKHMKIDIKQFLAPEAGNIKRDDYLTQIAPLYASKKAYKRSCSKNRCQRLKSNSNFNMHMISTHYCWFFRRWTQPVKMAQSNMWCRESIRRVARCLVSNSRVPWSWIMIFSGVVQNLYPNEVVSVFLTVLATKKCWSCGCIRISRWPETSRWSEWYWDDLAGSIWFYQWPWETSSS